MAELLYAGLTTGAGLQTLGEEYCDIIQVAGLLLLMLLVIGGLAISLWQRHNSLLICNSLPV